jgi:hypothetical protein
MPLASSKAEGVGNLVVYVGDKTGKDGVHGAAMASESFDMNNDAKKPNIQIGDPFYEKLLIESCLEVLDQKIVVAMQDMGAAGLTSSSFEMAAKGKVGFDLHLDQVPLRDSTLTPEEILLSESQERMLLVCKPKNLKKSTNLNLSSFHLITPNTVLITRTRSIRRRTVNLKRSPSMSKNCRSKANRFLSARSRLSKTKCSRSISKWKA